MTPLSITFDHRLSGRALRRTSFLLATAAMTICLGFGVSSAASAQDSSSGGARNYFAVGVGAVPEFEGSDDYQAIPFVAGRYATDYATFELRGLGFSADFAAPRSEGRVLGGVILNYDLGREDADNPVIATLTEVDPTLELGAFVGYSFQELTTSGDALTVRLDAVIDVGDGHGGTLVTPSLSYSRPLTQRLFGNVGISATYASDDYHQAFFGVTAADAARSGLPVFQASSGISSVDVTAGFAYQVTQDWGIIGQAGYSRLVNDAADSPIVTQQGSRDQFFIGFGVSRSF